MTCRKLGILRINQSFLSLFSTMPPLSNCSLFKPLQTLNRLLTQMYLLVNLLINLSMFVQRLRASAPQEIY